MLSVKRQTLDDGRAFGAEAIVLVGLIAFAVQIENGCSIQEYIVANFTNNDMSLDMVAKHVYVHPSYISRIFSQQFNTPFRTYINGLRVNLASELLDTTDKSIGDICHEVGFSDHSYFNRVFKSIRGLTPSEYRNRPRDRRS